MDSISPVAIVTVDRCYRVIVRQNDQSITTNLPFKIMRPASNSPAVRYEPTIKAILTPPQPGTQFPAGATIGYVQLFSSSMSMAQLEDVE